MMYYLFRVFYFLASIKLLSKSWWAVYYLDFFRKKTVFKNLDIAFPQLSKKEKTQIAKDTYKNFLKFFEDVVDIDKNPAKLEEIEIINETFFLDSLKQNRPVILMTAHFGNWELAPRLISKKYNQPMGVVMREIENPQINAFFKKIRANELIKLINKKKGAKEIIRAIKEKRVIGILIDQHTVNKQAPVVKFFKPVTFNPAISKLAKATGAIVIPAFVYKNNGGYALEFQTPKEFEGDIKSFTQWQASTIEEMIKKHPSQYYWFHNRWKRECNE
ncbi:MAG: lysophospholipid acyltransferase family protein [Epsilonproteobacteria bacterium]|nr:lysophospholipid acyltransferase family protein [Campylobacterota bacterium]